MTKNKKKIRKKRPPPPSKNKTILVVGRNNKLKKFKVTKDEMLSILELYSLETYSFKTAQAAV